MKYWKGSVETWFDRLEILLKDRKLPCEHGPARVCSASEFMFMQGNDETASFKHRDTRNYVKIWARHPHSTLTTFELFIPITQESFHLGFFDKL